MPFAAAARFEIRSIAPFLLSADDPTSPATPLHIPDTVMSERCDKSHQTSTQIPKSTNINDDDVSLMISTSQHEATTTTDGAAGAPHDGSTMRGEDLRAILFRCGVQEHGVCPCCRILGEIVYDKLGAHVVMSIPVSM